MSYNFLTVMTVKGCLSIRVCGFWSLHVTLRTWRYVWRVTMLLAQIKPALNKIVSWEPEGRYQYSKMFHWEPEGRYRTMSMAISPPLVLNGTSLNSDSALLALNWFNESWVGDTKGQREKVEVRAWVCHHSMNNSAPKSWSRVGHPNENTGNNSSGNGRSCTPILMASSPACQSR